MTIADVRRYLDGLVERTADVREAAITARNLDGTYVARLLKSNQTIRVSPANPNDKFVVGTWVLIGRASASGNVKGLGDVILSRAPEEQRGLSGGTIDSNSRGLFVPVVLSIDPEPITVERGGAAVAAKIYGVRLTASPTSDDPEITIASVVAVADGIEFTVAASVDAEESSAIAIYGVTFDAAVATIAPVPRAGLFVLEYCEIAAMGVQRVDTDDLTVIDEVIVPFEGAAGIAADADSLYLSEESAVEVYKFSRIDYSLEGTFSLPSSKQTHMRPLVADARIWCCITSGPGIQSVLTSDGSSSEVKNTSVGGVTARSLLHDGTYYWIGSDGLYRWTRTGDVVDASISAVTAFIQLAIDASYVYALDSADSARFSDMSGKLIAPRSRELAISTSRVRRRPFWTCSFSARTSTSSGSLAAPGRSGKLISRHGLRLQRSTSWTPTRSSS